MKNNARCLCRWNLGGNSWGWGLGIFVLLIYGVTLCPSVGGGDSGELATVAYTLGIAHPPGYPLYTLFGKLFTTLPFGTVAWRVNLFSAVCGALASVSLARAVGAWTQSSRAGLLAGGLFAFSPL